MCRCFAEATAIMRGDQVAIVCSRCGVDLMIPGMARKVTAITPPVRDSPAPVPTPPVAPVAPQEPAAPPERPWWYDMPIDSVQALRIEAGSLRMLAYPWIIGDVRPGDMFICRDYVYEIISVQVMTLGDTVQNLYSVMGFKTPFDAQDYFMTRYDQPHDPTKIVYLYLFDKVRYP